MCAVRTSLIEISTNKLKNILGKIRKAIPVGFEHHKEKQEEKLMPKLENGEYVVVAREYNSALKQIGTLGGGNHFIDILKGSDGYIWIMLHSGSRNIGKQVADYYNKLAEKETPGDGYSYIDKELAPLHLESLNGKNYLREMRYCVDFALANRALMMQRIKEIFEEEYAGEIQFDPMINIAHNYA